MPNNRYNPVKRRLIPLHNFFIFISILLILSSCSSAPDKKEIASKTDDIMTALVEGNYDEYPQIFDAVNQLGADESVKLKSSLASITQWKINVGQIQNNKAAAKITSEDSGKHYEFVFSFTKIENNWVLDENILLSQNIDFIPFIGLED